MMTVKTLSELLECTCIAGHGGLERTVTGGYVGDFLSWVMGHAEENSAWITVMGNINAVAVALLADVSCIILCDGAHLDEDARRRADENNIPVLASSKPAFALALALGKALGL